MYRVMIVDDEIVSQNIIKSYIDDTLPMYAVTSVCGNGQEALDSFLSSPVDIILVDIRMPVMDGLTFIERLQKITGDVEIIVLSAYSEFIYAQTAMRFGVAHYILKPLDFKELRSSLDAAVQALDYRRIAQTALRSLNDEQERNDRKLCRSNQAGTTGKQPLISSNEISSENTDLSAADLVFDASVQTSINNAINYMREHYAEDLTRDAVAETVYMSGAHFSRCFKIVTKVSYKDYLTEIRMQKAIELLKTNAKISDIAKRVGYSNPNRFNINFRQYTSYTPSEYRTFVLKMY